jgi:hypothetical protein
MSERKIRINRADREIYDKLKYNDGPFKGRKNPEIFMTSMILGYHKYQTRTPLDSFEPYTHVDHLGPQRRTMIKAIAVAEEGMGVLSEPDKVYDIAEEYAATGIKILESMVFNHEYDFIKKLESILVNEYDSKDMGKTRD